MSAVPQNIPASQTTSLDAPHGGWDAFHSLDAMPPENAILLDNLIPSEGDVETRLGTAEYADLTTAGLSSPAPVETVASFFTRNDSQLLAMAGGGMWDITDPTPAALQEAKLNKGGAGAQAITLIAAEGTFANDRWQTQNFRKADEEGVLIMENGVDPVQIWNGAALTNAAFNDTDTDPGPPTPLDLRFIGGLVFKGRMYYWLDDDNAFYYCEAGAYQGTIRKFDLGSQVRKGGKIKFITTWTQQDSGDGKDDFFVVVFNTGETLIYQGDDPDSIGFWEIVGKYSMAEPLSIRGESQYGSDTIVMTKDGYVGLSSIIQQGRTSDVPQFSRLIHNAIKAQTALRGDNFGWDCQLFAKQGLFIFNVPLSSETYNQHVMNVTTQRWCRFQEINVTCLEVHQERLFGGTIDGRVLAILETPADEGNPITFTALPAYQYLGAPGQNKHMVAAQPLTTNSSNELFDIRAYADFEVPDLQPVPVPPSGINAVWAAPPSPGGLAGSLWDEANWATDDTPFTYKGWQNVSAYGFSVSYLLRFAKVNESVRWRSTNIRFFVGGAQ